ncbi:MAG: hypothetical protein NC304_14105, partial [Robinsoniella sp.]|nr:hypothetical protein [Robinsoniella sp.]
KRHQKQESQSTLIPLLRPSQPLPSKKSLCCVRLSHYLQKNPSVASGLATTSQKQAEPLQNKRKISPIFL